MSAYLEILEKKHELGLITNHILILLLSKLKEYATLLE